MKKGIRAFRYWRKSLSEGIEMTSSKIMEEKKCKLFNKTVIIYHSRTKTEKCEYQIPTNNNKNIG